MKLASFRAEGADRIGIEVDGGIVDIAGLIDSPGDMIGFIGAGRLDELRTALAAADPATLAIVPLDAIEWLPPVRTPSKVVCIALNNRSLDAIKIKAPTDHPAFFLKPYTALTGHRSAIRMKAKFGFTHPEPELAVVIGRTLQDATPAMGTLQFATGSNSGSRSGHVISEESEAELGRLVERDFEVSEPISLAAGDATFHGGWTIHRAFPNETDRMRAVMTVIWFADGEQVLPEPLSAPQQADLERWLPGCVPGGAADSPINPLVG